MKWLVLAALAGSVVVGVAASDKNKKKDVPPPYVPGWVRPGTVPDRPEDPNPKPEEFAWGA